MANLFRNQLKIIFEEENVGRATTLYPQDGSKNLVKDFSALFGSLRHFHCNR